MVSGTGFEGSVGTVVSTVGVVPEGVGTVGSSGGSVAGTVVSGETVSGTVVSAGPVSVTGGTVTASVGAEVSSGDVSGGAEGIDGSEAVVAGDGDPSVSGGTEDTGASSVVRMEGSVVASRRGEQPARIRQPSRNSKAA